MFKSLRLCPPGDYNDDNIAGENTEEEEAWGWLGQKQGSYRQTKKKQFFVNSEILGLLICRKKHLNYDKFEIVKRQP